MCIGEWNLPESYERTFVAKRIRRKLPECLSLPVVGGRIPSYAEWNVVGGKIRKCPFLMAFQNPRKGSLAISIFRIGLSRLEQTANRMDCGIVKVHNHIRAFISHYPLYRGDFRVYRFARRMIVPVMVAGNSILPLIAVHNTIEINKRNHNHLHVLPYPFAKGVLCEGLRSNPFNDIGCRSLVRMMPGCEQEPIFRR